MPSSGTWHGRESVVRDVWTSFVEYRGGPGVVGLETDQFLDAGDHVVVTGRFVGRDSEGSQLDAPCAHVVRMSGGTAVRFPSYTDWTVEGPRGPEQVKLAAAQRQYRHEGLQPIVSVHHEAHRALRLLCWRRRTGQKVAGAAGGLFGPVERALPLQARAGTGSH